VPLVYLEDLTILGPGSEWFWTAVSGLTVAGTLIVTGPTGPYQCPAPGRPSASLLTPALVVDDVHRVAPEEPGLAGPVAMAAEATGMAARRIPGPS
jgi:hypothetical protein